MPASSLPSTAFYRSFRTNFTLKRYTCCRLKQQNQPSYARYTSLHVADVLQEICDKAMILK
jgi:hypothetical protein